MTEHPQDWTQEQEEQFENILKDCFNVQPTEGFALRINTAAFSGQPRFIPWFKGYIGEMMCAYHLPSPIITVAITLMLGASVGFGLSPLVDTDNNTNLLNISTIFYGERGIL